MASVMKISEAELLDALAQAVTGTAPEDAQTVREMCRQTGVHELRIKRALAVLMNEGRLVSHRVRRTGIDGRNALVPAYTITPAKKRKP